MNQRVNEYNQPIGGEVVNWKKRKLPGDMRYVGKYTIITRLSCIHFEDLYIAYENTAPHNWTYLMDDIPQNDEEFEQLLVGKMENAEKVYYVVMNKETNKPLGMFALMRIDPENGVIEVGDVNFSDQLKGTKMSTEAHQLLAQYVFEELQYRRYEWKCDSLNAPSIRAAKRLGFTYEGTFRKAVIYKNRLRDTCWFSMLKEEWPHHKQAITNWLKEDNFDDQGVQIRKLASFK